MKLELARRLVPLIIALLASQGSLRAQTGSRELGAEVLDALLLDQGGKQFEQACLSRRGVLILIDQDIGHSFDERHCDVRPLERFHRSGKKGAVIDAAHLPQLSVVGRDKRWKAPPV